MNFGFEDRIAGASFWLHTWWIYVTVVWSQNDLDIPHLQTHQVKKKPVQRLILMCLVYDRKLTFCHFVLLQTLKTRALSRVQTKGFIFLLLRVIFRTGSSRRDGRNSSPVNVSAEPLIPSVSTPVFAQSARLGFLVSDIARCLLLKAAQTARHSSLFWQILTVFKGVIYF